MDILKLLPKGLKIECPFTWELDEKQVRNFNEVDAVLAEYEESPITRFIEMNTIAYIRSVQDKIDAAEDFIEEIDDIWKNIKKSFSEEKNYSVDVLEHLKDATALCIYLMAGKKEEAKAIETKINDAKNFNSNVEKGTIFGSQALASALFHEESVDTCIKLAKQASSYAPNCAVWHYVLAKSLRKKRRQINNLDVSDEERKEFLMCYKLSPSDHYGISVARMYKESRNWSKCSDIYNEIYRKEPANIKVRLVLALCFINNREYVKAKKCLDYIKNLLPPEKLSKTYYHYLAKYYEKTKNYTEAKENYLKAVGDRTGNYPADMDHYNLIKNTAKNNCEGMDYLKNMLKRYEHSEIRTVRILVHLALVYLFDNYDVKLAADYFLKALKINSHDPQLESFSMPFQNKTKYNIFDLIRTRILTGNENSYGDTFKELKSYCMEYENRKESVITENSDKDSLYQQFAKALSIKE